MKSFALLLLMLPLLANSQRKKEKLRLAAQKQQLEIEAANTALATDLETHINYLTGISAENTPINNIPKAYGYIIEQYKQAGLTPIDSTTSFLQSFSVNDGFTPTSGTVFTVNGRTALLNTDYFPLAFGACKSITGKAALSLNEAGNPWFKDIKDWLDTASNVSTLQNSIKKTAIKAAAKGATALLVYNSGTKPDSLSFNESVRGDTLPIPIIYITTNGIQHFFADAEAIQDLKLTVNIGPKKRQIHNIQAFIDNHAEQTVIITAHYDYVGMGNNMATNDTLPARFTFANDNASGTAACLSLAKLLKQSAFKSNNYLFVNFGGEAINDTGSKYWLQHLSNTLQTNYLINMQAIGIYTNANPLVISGYGTSNNWKSIFERIDNKDLLVKFYASPEMMLLHSKLLPTINVPALFITDGSAADDKQGTSVKTLNYQGIRQIVQYVYTIIATANDFGQLNN